MRNSFLFFIFFIIVSSSVIGQINRAIPSEEKKIWKELKKKSGFKKVFKKYERYRFEIIYSQVDRNPNGAVQLTNYHFGDSISYFYPASTVKLPLALVVLEKLGRSPFYNLNANMFLRMADDSICHYQYSNTNYEWYRVKQNETMQEICRKNRISVVDFCKWNNINSDTKLVINRSYKVYHRQVRPTINDLIKSMLVYSDNMAYNKLFEMVGGDIVNDWLMNLGFEIANISLRFLFCNENENTVSHSFDVLNDKDVIFYHGENRKWVAPNNNWQKGIIVGKKHNWAGEWIEKGRDFSNHNKISLRDLHEIMQRLFVPVAFSPEKHFLLDSKMARNVQMYLGMHPNEVRKPLDSIYDNWEDGRNNFLWNGDDTIAIDKNIRMYNIIGQAYGFSTDCLYFTDNKNKIEFFLSCRIYTNKNEILGDDTYEYKEIAMPLMKFIGNYFYELEKARNKEFLPDFTILHSYFDSL